jgi:hypothetical protein
LQEGFIDSNIIIAATLEKAEEALGGTDLFDLVVLDGNLSPDATGGGEGSGLVPIIRDKNEDTKIIWTSTDKYGGDDSDLDEVLSKRENSPKEISRAIINWLAN